MNRDELFVRFAAGLFVVLLAYGIGMVVVLLWGNENIGLRMLSGFATMFAGVIGLGSGYLLGTSRPNSNGEKK